jgi:hypothetical protein
MGVRIAITIIINHLLWWQTHSLADSAGDMLRQSASQSAVLGVRIGFTIYHRPPTIDTAHHTRIIIIDHDRPSCDPAETIIISVARNR